MTLGTAIDHFGAEGRAVALETIAELRALRDECEQAHQDVEQMKRQAAPYWGAHACAVGTVLGANPNFQNAGIQGEVTLRPDQRIVYDDQGRPQVEGGFRPVPGTPERRRRLLRNRRVGFDGAVSALQALCAFGRGLARGRR